MPLGRVWIGLLLLVLSQQTLAATTCSIAGTSVQFGAYSHMDILPNDSTGNLTVECVEDAILVSGDTLVNYSIALGPGGSGVYTSRELLGSADSLNYNLFTDPTHLIVWGDGTSGSSTRSGSLLVPGCIEILFITTCTPVNVQEVIYARIPAAQLVRPDSYSDTIQVTISY